MWTCCKMIILFIPLLAIMPCAADAGTQVENVRFEQRGNQVVVFYDLHGAEDAYTIRLKLSSDGGMHFDIIPKAISGDVGEHVAPGPGKRIVWDVSKDVKQLSGDRFVFSVTANWESSGTAGMVLIKGGWFEMGDAFGDGENDEKPAHRVYVDDFYMDATEVTVGQFRAFVEATGYGTTAEKAGWAHTWAGSRWEQREGVSWRNPGFSQDEDHPVVCVSWHDAKAYAEWVGKRLPTEAEWEYAARNRGKKVKYPWGNGTPTGKECNFADRHTDFSWSYKNGNDTYRYTAPVGSYPPNELGLYDMAGNVWEWCHDWYGDDYYSRSPESNPTGLKTGSYRSLRGGSWFNTLFDMRCASRNYYPPTNRIYNIGIRCVRRAS